MRRFTLSICIFIFILAGCGIYTFNPRGKAAFGSISIERFSNETPEYGLEDKMTDQIIDAFISDGTIKVVAPGNSEAVLSGTLKRYDRKPYNPDEFDQVESYAVTMLFNVVLTNTSDQSEIWNEQISQIGVYNLETETEEDGQAKAILLLVEDIINKTTKSW